MRNETGKKIAQRAVLGFIYGVFIGQTILILESLFKGDGNFYPIMSNILNITDSKIGAVIIQYFLTGLIGVSFAATTVIFETDSWSITQQTVIHFIINSIVMFLAGFICGWFPHTVKSTLIWFAIFILVYTIIWLCFTFYYKAKVKQINEKL
ncbi:MAG: DUF3021 domain-containing protein [Treponema sp.]|nr:DUF3021 domain-containing protein [Treponema sp.]